MIVKNDFHALATAALQRGFKYPIPLTPDTKKPAVHHYTTMAPVTQERIEEWTKQFPHHGVGIVCKRGIGTSLCLDTDKDGVIAQIEQEAGRTFPDTLTNASRLEIPWKRHYWFTQTKYSCEHLPRTINANNVDGRYDVKVNGQVVWAGTIHPVTGQPYTTVKEVEGFPIGIPVPDWLVDWWIADVERYARLRVDIWPDVPEVPANPEIYERVIQQKIDVDTRRLIGPDEKIPIGERYKTLWQKNCAMGWLNFPRIDIANALIGFAQARCEDGENYVRQNREKIIAMAYSPKLDFGNTWVGQKGRKSKRLIIPGKVSRQEVLFNTFKTFPTKITTKQGWELLTAAMEKAGFTLDKDRNADQQAVSRARAKAGYEVEGRLWCNKCQVEAKSDVTNVTQTAYTAFTEVKNRHTQTE